MARWTLNHDALETRPLPDGIHPGLSAVMLVREALSEYNIPSHVDVTYKGMKRLSGSGAHHLTDGVLTCRATFRSLIGKKHEIDIPVIVHRGYMVYPEVFQDQGRIEVLAQSAFDEMLMQANVKQKMQDRLNMYSPHVFPVDLSEPKVQPGMFGVVASSALSAAARWVMQNPQAVLTAIQAAPAVLNTLGALVQKVRSGNIQLPDAEALLAAMPQLKEMAMNKQATHTPHGLDPAERDRSDRLHPSQVVKLQSDVEVRLRGGSHVVYPSGTEVMIVRDMSDEGLIYYCEFPDGRRAPVHYDHLPG